MTHTRLFASGFLLLSALLSDCTAALADDAKLPRAATRKVSFAKDIRPILERRCASCHGYGQRKGRFRVDTRATVLAGGRSGAAVVPGSSDKSLLIELVAGLDPESVMPAKGPRLTAAQVGLLRAWIDQGLEWQEGFSLAEKPGAALLVPRRPVLPPSLDDLENPVDRLLRPYFTGNAVDATSLVDDRTYARRVYLDVVGLLPTPKELEAFLADDRSDKRTRLVDELLGDSRRYAEHWLTFWNDALRNDYRGTGYIDGGRKQITRWLYRALYDNVPYDRFVRELIQPGSESEGFIKGIVWRGVVNASQMPPVQAAQNVAQVFLGTNLKCASCHDSFVNHWKLADAYGLANVFADKPLEIHRCDRPTGEMAATRFLYPELGTIDGSAPRQKRLEQLAAILTSPKNGRLTRVIVNRLWARLFGRGLIEPIDALDDSEPWHADLLDWLAVHLVDEGYDLKKILRLLLTSRAYQLPAVRLEEEPSGPFVFRGPLVRRMSAEQFVDAVASLTGVWKSVSAASFKPWFEPGTRSGAADHRFVRFASGLIRSGSVEVDVEITGARTLWLVVTEGEKGKNSDWADWAEPHLVGPAGTKKLTELKWRSAISGHGKVQVDKNAVGHPLRLDGRGKGGDSPAYGLGTHAFSVIVYDLPSGYTRFRARVGPDAEAVANSPDAGHEMEFFVFTDMQVRAALLTADSLLRALGRPNREQIVTRRQSKASTLQALEMTNGSILSEWLVEGARQWLEREGASSSRDLVRKVYARGLGRAPRPSELATATELVGSAPTGQGLEDLLWAVLMLPEFQLIY